MASYISSLRPHTLAPVNEPSSFHLFTKESFELSERVLGKKEKKGAACVCLCARAVYAYVCVCARAVCVCMRVFMRVCARSVYAYCVYVCARSVYE
jgi:hypothetical protein